MKPGGTTGATLSGHAADEGTMDEPAIVEGGAGEQATAREQLGVGERPADATVAERASTRKPAVSEHAAEQLGVRQPGVRQRDADETDAEQPGLNQPGTKPVAAEPVAAEPVADAISRARKAAGRVRNEAATEAHRQALVLDFFAQPVHDYVYQSLGRPVVLLQAGRATPIAELGLDKLRQDGFDLSVISVDADHGRRPRTRPQPWPDVDTAIQTDGGVTIGDLRAIPLPPRSVDVIHCSLLLDRISHVPLVLDRFTAALRPGGLLLLRIRDRDCAAGFLDRRMPGWARRALWARLYPGEPGPFPAIYEPTASGRGIAAYMLMRGLVITQRRTARTLPHQPERLCHLLSVARGTIARLSRDRLTDAHDEMLFVIRKPEDRFARVVLIPRRPGGVPARD
jgi:hypothetical protein